MIILRCLAAENDWLYTCMIKVRACLLIIRTHLSTPPPHPHPPTPHPLQPCPEPVVSDLDGSREGRASSRALKQA